MPLPDITHLQFAILRSLIDGDQSGAQLRQLLSELGSNTTRAAFYQLMFRLEEAGLVAGRYEQSVVDGVAIKERVYKISGGGKSAVKAAQSFYLPQTTAIPRFA